MRFRNKRAGKWQRKNQTNFFKDNRRRNLRQYVSRDENPQRVNEMDSPSFEGFHAQLDCKLTYGNQNQTQLKLVQHIKFRVQKQNKKNRNDEEYSQTGITVKIHSNHVGVRATAIMLRSVAAGSSWRSPVIAIKQALEITAKKNAPGFSRDLFQLVIRWRIIVTSRASIVVQLMQSATLFAKCKLFFSHLSQVIWL